MNNTNVLHCRLCAQSKAKTKMVDMENHDKKRRELVAKLLRLNTGSSSFFDDNILPKTVCLVCLNALQKAYDFVLSVDRAQEVLTDLIITKKVKQEATFTGKQGEQEHEDSVLYETFDADSEHAPCDIAVKIEAEKSESERISEFLKKRTERTSTARGEKRAKNKRKNLTNSDALPLSQIKLTWKDYVWICSYCDIHYSTIAELRSHSIECHQSCNAYRCLDCNIRKLRLDKFILHVKRHKKYLKFSCYICLAKFPTLTETNKHQLTHFNTDHRCPGCNTCFTTKEELTQHKETYYEAKRAQHLSILNSVTDDLTCLLCNKMFKSKGSLSSHLVTHTDRKRDHTCDKCGKCFFNKSTLAGHLLLHDDSRPFVCVICKFAFKTKSQLRNHIGVHGNEKPFSCDQCGRCFRLQKQLQSHKIIHTDSLPYTCTFCSKKFRFKPILNQHIRQHTGVKPYSCTICTRDFTNWPNYNKHMKRLHGIDTAKTRRTPDGVFPINPSTGEIVMYQEVNNAEEWKKQMLLPRKRSGRPKFVRNVKMDMKMELTDNVGVQTSLLNPDIKPA